MLGRVLRSSATTFTFGRTARADAMPAFGHLVKAQQGGLTLYALVYEIVIADDPFVRQIVAASDAMSPERVEDMRQRRQVPVEITALTIAFRQGDRLIHGIPPRPPEALRPIHPCDCDETREVLADFAFFRLALTCGDCPSDELLAASLIHAAGCQLPGQERDYLIRAGRELVRLLSHDPARLDAILRRLAAALEATS
jgi:hypothetical protein